MTHLSSPAPESPNPNSSRSAFVSLFIASAATMLGIGIIVPVLPLFAEDLGASGLVVGLIFAGFALARGVFAPIIGSLSDKHGRKKLMMVGLGLYVLLSIACGLVTSPMALLAVRTAQGFASVMVTPIAQSYIGDITPVGREGEYMNLFYLSLFGGMAVGPFVGGYLSDLFSLRAPFWAMAAAGVVALGLVAALVPKRPPVELGPDESSPRLGESLKRVFADRQMRGIISYIGTRGFYRWGFNSFFPVFAVQTVAMSRTQVGLLLSGYMVGGGLMQYPMGRLVDRFAEHRAHFIVGGGSLTACLMLLLPSMTTMWALAPTILAMGLISSLARASSVAIRTERGREHGMGVVTGAYTTSMSAGQVLGPLAFGLIVDLFDVRLSFYLGGVVGLLGAVGAYLLLRPSRPAD